MQLTFWNKSLAWIKDYSLAWYLLLAAIVIPVYARTMLPGLAYWGDSARFLFTGKILGTPHQPGYPK